MLRDLGKEGGGVLWRLGRVLPLVLLCCAHLRGARSGRRSALRFRLGPKPAASAAGERLREDARCGVAAEEVPGRVQVEEEGPRAGIQEGGHLGDVLAGGTGSRGLHTDRLHVRLQREGRLLLGGPRELAGVVPRAQREDQKVGAERHRPLREARPRRLPLRRQEVPQREARPPLADLHQASLVGRPRVRVEALRVGGRGARPHLQVAERGLQHELRASADRRAPEVLPVRQVRPDARHERGPDFSRQPAEVPGRAYPALHGRPWRQRH
mmetsp:Transcript_127575/g.318551  ORF Transcript_127575/g.318551 Transcript_127575/m.318551 type:complete len:269 (+) Transcript_127575:766-1572(+)